MQNRVFDNFSDHYCLAGRGTEADGYWGQFNGQLWRPAREVVARREPRQSHRFLKSPLPVRRWHVPPGLCVLPGGCFHRIVLKAAATLWGMARSYGRLCGTGSQALHSPLIEFQLFHHPPELAHRPCTLRSAGGYHWSCRRRPSDLPGEDTRSLTSSLIRRGRKFESCHPSTSKIHLNSFPERLFIAGASRAFENTSRQVC